MSHLTQTKYKRLFETKKVRNKLGKMVEIFSRRLKALDAPPRNESICLVCNKPMYYSEGQIMKSHKACRHKARHPND